MGVPDSGVDAVVLNVVAAEPTLRSFLTVFPAGSTRPTTSNLNPTPGLIEPNMVIAKVGINGEISIYNNSGDVQVVADVHGWFPTGSAYRSLIPVRLMDTRSSGVTIDGAAQGGGVIPAGGSIDLKIAGRGGLPATGLGSVVLNLTPVGATLPSFVTVHPAGSPRPNTSNLNPTPGLIIPNTVIVKVGANGEISIYNNSGTVDMVVDLLGWFPVGPAFTALDPARILDTRPGFTTIDGISAGGGEVGPAGVLDLQVAGRAGVPATGVGAVVLNLTGVNQNDGTFLTVYPKGAARPLASVLNPTPGLVSPNLVIAKVSSGGQVSIYNNTGSLDVIADVYGWFPSDVVAADDTATVTEDTTTAIDVLANDTDNDGGAVTIGSATQPLHGSVVLTGGSSGARLGVSYIPAANYCGPDAFTYTLNGGVTANVTVSVTCVDDVPIAVASAAVVNEDSGPTTVVTSAGVTDVDGGPSSIAAVTQPSDGTVVITNAGADATYQPSSNSCNTPPGTALDTFTYTLAPGGSVATVTVTVQCINDAPSFTKGADQTAVLDAGPQTVANWATAISAGPANEAGQAVDFVVTNDNNALFSSQPSVSPDGTLTFTPAAAASGAATVSVAIHDDGGTANGGTDSSAVQTFIITVNNAPVATAQSASTNEDTPLSLTLSGTDSDGGSLTFSIVTGPTRGSLGSLSAVTCSGGVPNTCTAGVTYTPNPDANGSDSFTFRVNDGGGNSAPATVSITITAVDDAPVAVGDSATVAEDSGATAVDVLANDTDVDGGPISVSSVTQPANGTVVITNAGADLTYQPVANFCGSDSFTYSVSPGGSTATVSVTVTCVDDPPVAVGDSATVAEDSGATAVGVLANDTDVDGGPISVSSVTQPANGTVVITNAGADLTYQPVANFCGSDSFTYSVSPGGSTATVSVTVTCVDDPPVAVGDSATVAEDSGATAVGVLANDTDVDGGPISVSSVTQPANGTVVITGGGTGLTYAPHADYCNDPPGSTPDTFTYSLAPGGSTATVSMTVTCVNDPPVVGADTFDGPSRAIGNTALVVDDPTDGAPDPAGPQKTVSGDILANDTDVDGPGPLVVTAGTFTTNDGGAVQIEADGDFTFFPKAGTSCSDTSDFFPYTVSDQAVPTPAVAVGTVTITIADCVWYIDASAAAGGAGTSSSPLNSLTGVNGAGGLGDGDAAGQTIFLYGGSYTGGLPLEGSQTVLAQRHGLSVPDGGGGAGTVTLEPPAGPSSSISGGMTLASNNIVQGVDLGDSVGFALSGSAVGTATINTVTTGAINNTAGGAVSIDTGALNAAFTSVSSTGGGNGIALTNVSGTFTALGGTITNAVGADVSLTGGSSAFTYNGTISDDLGALVAITGQTGGTKDFNGSITDLDNGTGNGISVTSNTGATIRFDGGLTLSTGVNPALNVTAGGTINVTDPIGPVNNTLATTTGTPLNVSNATIGSGGLTFEKISANGAASGIILNNTGAAGFLTITGNGGSCTSAANCSGGAIQNTTGVGISLNATSDVSIARMYLANTGSHGVSATAMTDGAGSANPTFSLVNSQVFSAGDADNENSLNFGTDASAGNNTGRIVVTDTVISQFEEQGLSVHNNTAGNLIVDVTGTPTGVTDSTTKFVDNNDTYGQGGILVLADSTANITLDVTGVMFDNIESEAAMVQSRAATSFVDVNLTNNISINGGGPDNFPAGGGFAIVSDKGGDFNFDIISNNLRDISGDGVVIVAEGTVQGRIDNNIISGTGLGDGIRIDTEQRDDPASGNNYVVTIEVINNEIGVDSPFAGIGDDGIQVLHRDGIKTLNLTIANNLIGNTSVANAGEGIRYFQDADISNGQGLTYANVRIANNTFSNIGTADGMVFILQDTADVDLTVTANAFLGGTKNILLSQANTSVLQISQASVPLLAAANTGSTASSVGTITFNSPVGPPPLPSNP